MRRLTAFQKFTLGLALLSQAQNAMLRLESTDTSDQLKQLMLNPEIGDDLTNRGWSQVIMALSSEDFSQLPLKIFNHPILQAIRIYNLLSEEKEGNWLRVCNEIIDNYFMPVALKESVLLRAIQKASEKGWEFPDFFAHWLEKYEPTTAEGFIAKGVAYAYVAAKNDHNITLYSKAWDNFSNAEKLSDQTDQIDSIKEFRFYYRELLIYEIAKEVAKKEKKDKDVALSLVEGLVNSVSDYTPDEERLRWLLALEMFKEAREQAILILQYEPEDERALRTLAEIYLRDKGGSEEDVIKFKQLKKLKLPYSYEMLAEIYSWEFNYKRISGGYQLVKAREHCQKALELLSNPDSFQEDFSFNEVDIKHKTLEKRAKERLSSLAQVEQHYDETHKPTLEPLFDVNKPQQVALLRITRKNDAALYQNTAGGFTVDVINTALMRGNLILLHSKTEIHTESNKLIAAISPYSLNAYAIGYTNGEYTLYSIEFHQEVLQWVLVNIDMSEVAGQLSQRKITPEFLEKNVAAILTPMGDVYTTSEEYFHSLSFFDVFLFTLMHLAYASNSIYFLPVLIFPMSVAYFFYNRNQRTIRHQQANQVIGELINSLKKEIVAIENLDFSISENKNHLIIDLPQTPEVNIRLSGFKRLVQVKGLESVKIDNSYFVTKIGQCVNKIFPSGYLNCPVTMSDNRLRIKINSLHGLNNRKKLLERLPVLFKTLVLESPIYQNALRSQQIQDKLNQLRQEIKYYLQRAKQDLDDLIKKRDIIKNKLQEKGDDLTNKRTEYYGINKGEIINLIDDCEKKILEKQKKLSGVLSDAVVDNANNDLQRIEVVNQGLGPSSNLDEDRKNFEEYKACFNTRLLGLHQSLIEIEEFIAQNESFKKLSSAEESHRKKIEKQKEQEKKECQKQAAQEREQQKKQQHQQAMEQRRQEKKQALEKIQAEQQEKKRLERERQEHEREEQQRREKKRKKAEIQVAEAARKSEEKDRRYEREKKYKNYAQILLNQLKDFVDESKLKVGSSHYLPGNCQELGARLKEGYNFDLPVENLLQQINYFFEYYIKMKAMHAQFIMTRNGNCVEVRDSLMHNPRYYYEHQRSMSLIKAKGIPADGAELFEIADTIVQVFNEIKEITITQDELIQFIGQCFENLVLFYAVAMMLVVSKGKQIYVQASELTQAMHGCLCALGKAIETLKKEYFSLYKAIQSNEPLYGYKKNYKVYKKSDKENENSLVNYYCEIRRKVGHVFNKAHPDYPFEELGPLQLLDVCHDTVLLVDCLSREKMFNLDRKMILVVKKEFVDMQQHPEASKEEENESSNDNNAKNTSAGSRNRLFPLPEQRKKQSRAGLSSNPSKNQKSPFS